MVTVALKTHITPAFMATPDMDGHVLSHLSLVPGVRPQLTTPDCTYFFLSQFSFPCSLFSPKTLGRLSCESQGSGQVDYKR